VELQFAQLLAVWSQPHDLANATVADRRHDDDGSTSTQLLANSIGAGRAAPTWARRASRHAHGESKKADTSARSVCMP
jgi:hypothetical protein